MIKLGVSAMRSGFSQIASPLQIGIIAHTHHSTTDGSGA
jgi:hypothetical protein